VKARGRVAGADTEAKSAALDRRSPTTMMASTGCPTGWSVNSPVDDHGLQHDDLASPSLTDICREKPPAAAVTRKYQ
jgi:hypothetical protein